MGWIYDRIAEASGTVIADFICPTDETRAAFGEAFTIWVDRITAGRFEDTNRMFVPPSRFDVRVTAEGTPQYWAEQALSRLRPTFDPQKPTALFLGCYQPFHSGISASDMTGRDRTGWLERQDSNLRMSRFSLFRATRFLGVAHASHRKTA
jgi:hypothetical protein